MGDRRSFWAWCMESEEPTDAERAALAAQLSERYGTAITAAAGAPSWTTPSCARPRISVPDALAGVVLDRRRTSARSTPTAPHFTDRTRAFNLDFPNPPDVVAHPRDEARARGRRSTGATANGYVDDARTAAGRRWCGA